MNANSKDKDTNIQKNKDLRKNETDREEYGYGYDRSVDDLKVLGQNDSAKNSEGSNGSRK